MTNTFYSLINVIYIKYVYRWHIMETLIDENKYSITDSGWVMYETLTENLNTLNKSLPTSLFNKCWPIFATKMSTVSVSLVSYLYQLNECIVLLQFLFNDILLANMFNRGGAQHLLCDVRYKLLPIFSKYTAKPTIYIER